MEYTLKDCEVRYDVVTSDGSITHVDAAAEHTRYNVYAIQLPDRGQLDGTRLWVVENFHTAQVLPDGQYHWTYLADKLGKGNERAGVALSHIMERALEAEAAAR